VTTEEEARKDVANGAVVAVDVPNTAAPGVVAVVGRTIAAFEMA
jgi:hypothetical protein